MLEWSLPEGTSIDDVKAVKAVNPASWITAQDLAEQREAVPEMAFRRFHANQWVERAGHWLPPGAWQAITGTPEFEEGEAIWVGVDVGGDRSTTAVVWMNANHQGASGSAMVTRPSSRPRTSFSSSQRSMSSER